jgi:hypothetical protein
MIFGDKLNSEDIEFGLEGGINYASISGFESDSRISPFNLGFYFDIRLKNQWNLYTGVLVKAKLGSNELSPGDLNALGIAPQAEEGTYSQQIRYFLVPALIKYNFPNRIYLETGPQFGLKYQAWVEFESETSESSIRIRDFNRDALNTIEAGWVVGTGYRLSPKSSMTFGIKYYRGITQVYKDLPGVNDAIFFKFNIPIGAVKNQEKE